MMDVFSSEKKAPNDKTADAPFQQGPTREKSKLVKNYEEAIKAYRCSFEGKSFEIYFS